MKDRMSRKGSGGGEESVRKSRTRRRGSGGKEIRDGKRKSRDYEKGRVDTSL